MNFIFLRVPFIKGFFVHSVVEMPFHVLIIKRSNYENQMTCSKHRGMDGYFLFKSFQLSMLSDYVPIIKGRLYGFFFAFFIFSLNLLRTGFWTNWTLFMFVFTILVRRWRCDKNRPDAFSFWMDYKVYVESCNLNSFVPGFIPSSFVPSSNRVERFPLDKTSIYIHINLSFYEPHTYVHVFCSIPLTGCNYCLRNK